MKSKKAQSSGISALGVSFMIAIFIFMIGMVVTNFIKDEVTRTRSTEGLNCVSDTISDGTKATCLLVDLVVPYFLITIFATAGGIITYRLLI